MFCKHYDQLDSKSNIFAYMSDYRSLLLLFEYLLLYYEKLTILITSLTLDLNVKKNSNLE